MTRKECLDKAAGCVLKDRQNQYGEPENSFDLIADLWTAYTGHVFIGSEVAAMMALLKLARLKRNAGHLDSAVDLAGYAACFAECASAEMARPVPFAPKAEGCEDLVFDEARMRESMPGIVPQDGPGGFDAPQTREALFRHIVDCNPSLYKPRTPTGEKLAEMAEEEKHG